MADTPTPSLDELLSGLTLAYERRRFRAIDFFEPYLKQRAFFKMGATKTERMFRAGTQLGKTYAGAAEMSYHLTGEYPPDWEGRRFDHPIKAWCAGVKSVLVRDGPQTLLCGLPGVVDAFGTGMIPKAALIDVSRSRGVTDAYDTIQVRHKSGGVSTLTFKSYEEGREKFQSTTLDFVWCDEEPPMDIYVECLGRISATGGSIILTFTPLKGRSDVVRRFMTEYSPDRGEVVMTIHDVKHLTPEQVEKNIGRYPTWQRAARTMGVPMQGEGRIFPVDDATITEDPIPFELVPRHWGRLWAMDFGIGHPFAAVLQLWDRDADVLHIAAGIRMADALPLQHAAAMKQIAGMVRVAYPKDGDDREKGTGETLGQSYRQQGLLLLPDHATWEDGGVSTEQGILEMHTRMTTNRYKVSRTMMNGDWGDEFRNYHRLDGKIVKISDDLLSASRIAVMQKRSSTTAPLGYYNTARRPPEEKRDIAEGVDFDVFTGH